MSSLKKLGIVLITIVVIALFQSAVPCCVPPVFAQDAAVSASPQTVPLREEAQTLERVLKSAPCDLGEFALAVGADRQPLPDDAQMPGPQATIAAVAKAFSQAAHRFGPVLAVAPPTMTVLNTDLNPPQIYDGMPTGDAVKLLTATLTSTQWSALTSPQGLGLTDLTSQDQQNLFRACVGADSRQAYSTSGGAPQTVDAATDLPRARLRLGSQSQVELPTSDHEWRGYNPPAAGPPRYTLAQSDQSDGATLYGNVIKTELPNKLKSGNLDFTAPALNVPVPMDGLKTVSDLVARIGAVTKLELYADPHYAGKRVTLVTGSSGANTAAPLPLAGDLLRALAFCLTATYRQVGPAYVLTDDLTGMGVRRLLFADMKTRAESQLQKPLDAAGDIIIAQHGMADLHPYEDGPDLAPTPAEIKKEESGEITANTPGMYLHLSFSDLTPAQQAAARASLAQAATPGNGSSQGNLPSLDGTLLLVTRPTLELLVPSVPGPIDINSDLQDLFRPSQKTMDAQIEARRKADEAKAPVVPKKVVTPPPPPALAQVFAGIPRRAALVDARTPADVDAAVAAMKTLNLNQLWLLVFTDGKARMPGSSFSAANGPDLLAEAHRATQGTDITVYAVLDLLTWGPDASADAQDLTLRGDNSAQAALRQESQDSQDEADAHAPITLDPAQKRLIVSPFAPGVQNALQTLVGTVRAAPGVAGIVWRETAPSGYVSSRESDDNSFGYSVVGRLAYLRHAHTDPIDIGESDSDDSNLPNWDSDVPDASDDWGRFRVASDERLLQTLLSAWTASAPNGGPRPILMQQRRDSEDEDWFGSWDSPRAPLPAYHASWEQQADDPVYPEEPGRQAKAQSKTALLRVDSEEAPDSSSLASYLSDHFKDRVKAPWDGFVLEFSEDNSGIKALQALAGDLSSTADNSVGESR